MSKNTAFGTRLLTFGVTVGAASTALSCAVCGFGPDPSRSAFLYTALLLTTTPLVFAGTIILVLRKMSNQRARKSSQSPVIEE